MPTRNILFPFLFCLGSLANSIPWSKTCFTKECRIRRPFRGRSVHTTTSAIGSHHCSLWFRITKGGHFTIGAGILHLSRGSQTAFRVCLLGHRGTYLEGIFCTVMRMGGKKRGQKALRPDVPAAFHHSLENVIRGQAP
jgi:hypothetical protein